MAKLRVISVLLLAGTLAPATLYAGDLEAARQSLRQSEIDFARSVRDKDRQRFRSLIAEEAIFVSGRSLRGREAIDRAWSVFFAEDGPELAWAPEVAEVLSSGDLGLTKGPYTLTSKNVEGKTVVEKGTFSSIWKRQPDGSWKIVFDSGCPPCPGN